MHDYYIMMSELVTPEECFNNNREEQNYLDMLQEILDKGIKKKDRTGVGTLSLFAQQLRFDLSKSFPLLTTKKYGLKASFMNYSGFYLVLLIIRFYKIKGTYLGFKLN